MKSFHLERWCVGLLLCMTACGGRPAVKVRPMGQVTTQPVTVIVNPYSVVLVWAASSSQGITGYNIYRSITSGSGFVLIGSTVGPTLTYTDTTVALNTTYYWVVTAYAPTCPGNPCGESGYSNQVSGWIPPQ